MPERIPRVRVQQDEDAEPVRVIVVEDKDDPSLGLFAAMIFISTLLGTILGLGADFGETLNTVDEIDQFLNPPPTLCLAGSQTILGSEGVGHDWKVAFEEQFDVKIDIKPTGSVGGVDLAAEGGCVDLLAMSEPMTAEQYEKLTGAGIQLDCAAEVGYDVISFITNINNPLVQDVRNPDDPDDRRPIRRPIEMRQLRGILSGSITNWDVLSNWPDGYGTRPIHIWARPGSGTTEVVLNRIANFIPTDSVPYPVDANYIECESNLTCLNRTLETPGSLFWVSVAWMRTQRSEYLKVISILDGDEVSVNPLLIDVNLEEYPKDLVRPLYLYVLGESGADRNELAREFLYFTRGIQGQELLEERNFYNHFSRPIDIEVEFPEMVFEIPESGPRTLCK